MRPTHRSRSRKLFAVLLCAGALCACAPADGLPRLAERDVAALSAGPGKVLLLVFEPADCLACATDMPRWLDARRRSPGSVAILVTRPPSPAESKVLARYRIPVDGVLERGAAPEPARGGSALLYVDGRLAASGALNRPEVQSTLERELAS
ncbi:MAG TPA: hypothetical protein VHG51_19180 [Longimicrobiaceae bacterium]|nr:hypothetical protein [Longimicrobiaceae bacterium]